MCPQFNSGNIREMSQKIRRRFGLKAPLSDYKQLLLNMKNDCLGNAMRIAIVVFLFNLNAE